MKSRILGALALAALSATLANAQFSSIKIIERVWNDNPGSGLTVTNNYPVSVQFAETGLDKFANRHIFYFSGDGGATESTFNNNDYWHIAMDVKLEPTPANTPRQEAGIYFNYSGWDGVMMVASDGEVACFGYILPFWSVPGAYTAGTTIRIGIRYFYDPVEGKNKFEYYAGNNRVILTPDNLEQGIIDGTKLGAYVQHQGSLGDPRDVTTTFSHIVAGMDDTDFSSVRIIPRVFNDNPLSILSITNEYPSYLEFLESDLNVWINRHLWYFSPDAGGTDSAFDNNEYWNIAMDVTIERLQGSVYRQEAGMYFNYFGWDGQFMVASDGEVAVFGYMLPFHTFGNIYTAGDTITIGMRYFFDPSDGKRKLEYYAGDQVVVKVPDNVEQGLLDGTKIGGYVQHWGSSSDPTATKTTISHITGVKLDAPPPATLEGTVFLDLFVGDPATQSANLELRSPGTQTVLYSYPITLSGFSGYSIPSVATGTFDIALKFPHFLRSVATNVVLASGANYQDFTVTNGDAFPDNEVGLLDLNAVLVSFGGADPQVDLDGDGTVAIGDLNVVLINFGKVGDL
ncbi:MAG: hypothetical protein HRF45_06530 [Fimbriimonadia bacterium]|jgi:hypothetical protein